MSETTLPIQVPSEDPKKKEEKKPEDEEKPKVNGEKKEGEDLVSGFMYARVSFVSQATVRRGPATEE